MGHRVDGNEPEKVLLIERALHLDPVDDRTIFLVVSHDAGDDGIDLTFLEILQAHVGPTNSQSLLRHIGDDIRFRAAVAEEHIGQCRKNKHRDQQYGDQDAQSHFDK